MKKITTKQLEEKVVEIIKSRPDVKYIPTDSGTGSCSYYKGTCTDGSKGCVIGQAFRAFGATTAKLKSFDNNEVCNEVCGGNDSSVNGVLQTLEMKPSVLLENIQEAQDQGSTWGTALENNS